MKKGFLDFPEPITKVDVYEIVSNKGCKLEYLVINDKWNVLDLQEFGLDHREIAGIWGAAFIMLCDHFDLDANKIMKKIFDSYERLKEKE